MRLLTLVLLTIVLSLSLLFLGICGAFKGEQGEPGDSVTQTDLTALVNEALTNRMEEVKGPQGEKGPQGVKGDRGDRGDQGIVGGQGIKGDKGEKGPIGLRGKEGPQGETGPQGIQGLSGPQGLSGLPGTIASLDSPATLSSLDFDLTVSQANWVEILSTPVTITKPSKVLIIANATASMSCALDSQCDYYFWLNVTTDPEDTGDAREVRVSQMKQQMTLPIALNRIVSLEPGKYSVKLLGMNDKAIGPLIRNILLTALVIED